MQTDLYYKDATTLDYDPTAVDWNVKTQVINLDGNSNGRWIVVKAISFESLGITGEVTTDTNLYWRKQPILPCHKRA